MGQRFTVDGKSYHFSPEHIKEYKKEYNNPHLMASEGGKYKYIKFGQKGVKTNQTAGQRKAFKSRHAKNIKRGKMSAAYWADKVKWSTSKTKEPKNKKWRKGS